MVRNKRKLNVPTKHGKQRPVTRSLSRRPTGVSETSELFSYKSNGNLQTSISPESELDIISHTFENNFTDDNGQCENGISHTETISESLEPSLENNGVIFNERNATRRTNNVTTDFNLYCYSSCEFGRKYDRSMLQCSTCMQWFHTICANVDAKHKNIWNCERCRSIPVVIDSLINQMSEVHTILSQMVEKQNFLCDQFCTLQNKNTKLEDEIKILKQENYKLRIRSYNRFIHSNSSDSSETDSDSELEDHGTQSFSKLQDHHTDTKLYNNNHDSDVEIVDMSPPVTENQSKKTPKSTCHDTKKPKLTVLGNSIVRNTGPVLSAALPNFDTMVYSTSGLGLQQAKGQAVRIFSEHNASDFALLQVGTCDANLLSKDELISKYVSFIDSVRHTAPKTKIIIAAVPHRLGSFNKATNAKTDFLNEHLRSLCEEDDGLLFLDANPPRTSAYYHSDGLHFNFNGSSFFGHYISKYLLLSSNFPKPQLGVKM